MEQIKIVFFILTTFFAIENTKIASEKTIVTVDPIKQELQITHLNLFTIIETKNDSIAAVKQFNTILNWNKNETLWAKELSLFSNKTLHFKQQNDTIIPQIIIPYKKNKELELFGIWFNSTKNEYSVNAIPQQNLKTEQGYLANNYWYFNANKRFTFTLKPFVNMPKQYQSLKMPLN